MKTGIKGIKSGVVAVLAALLCAGCLFSSREVTVSDVRSIGAQREYYRNELFSHDGLALESENFLRGNLMQRDLKGNPVAVLKKLDEFYAVSDNPKYLLIAADLCRYLATQVDEEEGIRYHLSNFYYTTRFFRFFQRSIKEQKQAQKTDEGMTYDVTASQGFRCYNEACCGIFAYLRNRNILDATSVTLQDRGGHKFVLTGADFKLSMPREAIEDFELCSSYEVKDLMQMNREPGVGVPLVAFVKENQWYSSLKTPGGLTIPVTFAVRRTDGFDEKGEAIPLRLTFIDTYLQETYDGKVAEESNVHVRMAVDFSTPLACFFNNLAERNLLAQMLDPQSQEDSDGLYMAEPYQPNKIPVVFIHGLMSSPETWGQMVNSLKNDPTIRQRYQFWFFSYSTGAPVLLSAKKLRDALRAAEKEFCTTPEATANFNKMVLVGHSMGGLLTRQMVQENPRYLFETIYGLSYDEIKARLQPEDFELFDSLTPYPLPFVHRAVFMAVPHKGAEMAQSFLGKLGTYLITAPKYLLTRSEAIVRINTALMADYGERMAKRGNRFFTGIDNLDPDNSFVRANGVSPMKKDLTYHCIIGNHNRAGAPDESDGIVPYWSSHLDGAASELIVKSDHSVHRRPAAIQELLRILLLHLKEVDKNS